MIGLGVAVFFGGYTLLAYSFSQIRGCNAGFIDILWPNRYTGCHPDANPNWNTGNAQSGPLGTTPRDYPSGGATGGGGGQWIGPGKSVLVNPKTGQSVPLA